MKPHTPLPWISYRMEPQSATSYFFEPYSPWHNAWPRYVTGDKGAILGIHADDAAYISHACNAHEQLVAFVKKACDVGVNRAEALAILRDLGVEA